MTSLAQQLQRLAVPYTQSVLSEDRRRVSLLFDPKEAANLDRETVFALGKFITDCYRVTNSAHFQGFMHEGINMNFYLQL